MTFSIIGFIKGFSFIFIFLSVIQIVGKGVPKGAEQIKEHIISIGLISAVVTVGFIILMALGIIDPGGSPTKMDAY